jgi:hypothetical protein
VPEPERLLVVARHEHLGEAGGECYLLLRWPDWPPPALLSLAAPAAHDDLDRAVADALEARLGVSCLGTPIKGGERIPVRMRHPRLGEESVGWLRPVAVRVTGEPRADALLEGYAALSLAEALDALPTEVERRVLREGARLLGDQA